MKLDNKAAYGLYLIQLCREADEIGKNTGQFVPHHEPTLEEFVEMREAIHKRRSDLKTNKWSK